MIRRGAIGVAYLALTLSSHGLAGQAAGVQFTDAHVHLNDPAAWIGLMDASGVRRAVVFRGRDIDNEGLRAAAERWPDRLIPFLSVSPEHHEYRGLWASDDPHVATIADSLLSHGGFYGIGEISVAHFPSLGFPEADFDPNGIAMRSLLEVARRHSVPVTVHVEITRLREFEALLEAFPEVTVIWAHGGYTPLFLAERLLTRHPNLMYELSARTWQRHPRSPDYTILRNGTELWPEWVNLIERMPTRFTVGTDASLRSLEGDRRKIDGVRAVLDQLDPPIRTMVASRNLHRILGIDP